MTKKQKEFIRDKLAGLEHRNRLRASARSFAQSQRKLRTLRRKGDLDREDDTENILKALRLRYSKDRPFGCTRFDVRGGPTLIYSPNRRLLGYL